MKTITLSLCLCFVFVGCKSNSETKDENNQVANNPDLSTSTDTVKTKADLKLGDCGVEKVVRFMTTDGVELVADYTPAAGENRGAVILFHMIPPSWDRKSYPPRVRNAFSELGVAVLNVDRRGAGDSGGVAEQAYTGETARLDVEAAVSFSLSEDRKCKTDPSKLMLVGASNGTTAVMDYTVNRSQSNLPDPAAIAWLSPGEYTESQNTIASNNDALTAYPILVAHPASEPWANQYTTFSDNWKVVTLVNGQHGTRNFDDGELEAILLPELIAWASSNIL